MKLLKKINFINQLDYVSLSYPTTMELNEKLMEPYPSVAQAGCGLCCVCMLVEGLTNEMLDINSCIDLSVRVGANVFGTDMCRLGQEISKIYDLNIIFSNSIADLESCIQQGGYAIINAGKKEGILSEGGHFLLITKIENNLAWILDPSYSEDKYSKPYRKNKFKKQGCYIIVALEVVKEECENRKPAFYLFNNKIDLKFKSE